MSEDSSVERLKKKLYRRGEKPKQKPRRALHDIEHEEVQHDWTEKNVEGEVEERDPKDVLKDLYEGHLPQEYGNEPEIIRDKQFQQGYEEVRNEQRVASRIIKVIFLVSLVFFIFAVALAIYYFTDPKHTVSCDKVDIKVSGQSSIASGKKYPIDITVKNNNPVPMRDTELEIVFPQGTRDADYPKQSLPSTRIQIGNIEVGEPVRSSARALLFGQEMTEYEIKSIVTYKIDDSDADFTCDHVHKVAIATAPVSLTVQGLEEISSGQELELELVINSNSEEVVPDLRLIVEYPFGFDFVSSEPEPTTDENVWDVGDVTPGTERVLKLKGVIRGQGTEARAIGVTVGEKDPNDESGLSTILQKVDHPLLVTRPFLELELALNNDTSPQFVSQLGTFINATLRWSNNTKDALHDVEIDGILRGVMLKPESVRAKNGFFRSVDKTITWTPQTTSEMFRVIEPGEEGELTFSFSTKEFDERTSLSNPTLDISFDVRARRISDNIPIPQNLTEQAVKTIVFDSDLTFDAYAVYNIGKFTNTGPHPPKVNEQTTYTVIWRVSNTMNDTNSVVLKGVLPVYVEWMNTTSPNDESVTFNPVSREVVWQLGDVPRATGYETPVREVQFQISTIPSISQIDDARLDLVTNLVLRGVDNFTENMLERKVLLIDSDLINDPYFKNIRGEVIE